MSRFFNRRANQDILDAQHINELQEALEEDDLRIDDHVGDKSNPHNVTAAQLGVYLDSETDNLLSSKADKTTLLVQLPSVIGTNGQVLKSNGTTVSWQPDSNTTYAEISEQEIEEGTSSTLRTLSGRRVQAIVNKAQQSVPSPIEDAHAANKQYVDSGLSTKAADIHSHPIADIAATGTRSSSTFLRGDGTWNSPPNTTYSNMSVSEANAGTATAARVISASTLKGAIAAFALSADKAAVHGKGYVNHGATANVARPTGFASIEWMGSVEPLNMENGDTWVKV